MTDEITIQLPLGSVLDEAFTKVVRAYIVPNMAPHLPGTFAVHRNPWAISRSRSWIVSNVETGSNINRHVLSTSDKFSARYLATCFLATKTAEQYEQAMRKMPKWCRR